MPYTKDGIGYRHTDTSEAAAQSAKTSAETLRARVLDVLAASAIPRSAEGIARSMGEHPASVKPRISELRNAGKVRDSKKRGRTDMGRSCILWELTEGTNAQDN
ncbi:hypothetical protein [Maritimibacter sp. DP1N21-5]|uniref:hypothetical protein n=1 Tax=Maritimibacter sp. DP1N21-5 TaxID=2836867 RepID=UPI001C438ED2|nr:hypothetical protein [Maritimibacter sp. DP1N21-5]MBV7408727.1 hypothetical protein [Maritimibacter sp. DP1N21-5]